MLGPCTRRASACARMHIINEGGREGRTRPCTRRWGSEDASGKEWNRREGNSSRRGRKRGGREGEREKLGRSAIRDKVIERRHWLRRLKEIQRNKLEIYSTEWIGKVDRGQVWTKTIFNMIRVNERRVKVIVIYQRQIRLIGRIMWLRSKKFTDISNKNEKVSN